VSEAVPLCFTERWIYELWKNSEAKVPPQMRCRNHCTDCTPTYQLRARKAGKCEHPETMFALDRQGGVYGIRKEDR
jgi:hypothetical protein